MFIAFEGIEGTGKSKLRDLLAIMLEQCGISVYTHSEPREPSTSKQLESCVFDFHDILTNSLKNRFSAYVNVIRPKLADDITVITNRWNATTVAYHGYGRCIGHDQTYKACFCEKNQEADVTFCMVSSYDRIFLKLQNLNRLPDFMLDNNLSFYERVCKGYSNIKKRNMQNFHMLDCMLPLEQQLCNIIKILNDKYESKMLVNKLLA